MYTLGMEKTKQEIKDEIKHLRKAANCSCDSYYGRMTRQLLNRQADDLREELENDKNKIYCGNESVLYFI